METIPRIVSVEPVGPSQLLVRFSNGVNKLYDCRPLFDRPAFALLANPAFFCAVRADPGGYGISWSDDIDLSEYELWVRGRGVGEELTQRESPTG